MTALMIKYGTIGETITCDIIGPDEQGKFGYWISFWKDNRPHISPLLEQPPCFETKIEAQEAIDQLIEQIKSLKDI